MCSFQLRNALSAPPRGDCEASCRCPKHDCLPNIKRPEFEAKAPLYNVFGPSANDAMSQSRGTSLHIHATLRTCPAPALSTGRRKQSTPRTGSTGTSRRSPILRNNISPCLEGLHHVGRAHLSSLSRVNRVPAPSNQHAHRPHGNRQMRWRYQMRAL